MKLPRRNFCIWQRALPHSHRVARRMGAELSVAAGAIDRRLSPWRRGRHLLTPYGAMAVGPAWPAVRHREPAGCREQYRHRSGREGAAGRLHAPPCQHYERDQRDTLRQAQFHRPRHRAGRWHHARAAGHGGKSIGSGQDGFRVHRLCQGQSGQDQYGIGGQREHRAM